jgi:N-acetylglucosamine-6-sulfatase
MTHTRLSFLSIVTAILSMSSPYCFAQSPEADKPNIIFIMVDDGRYDEYRPTGAPDWFEAPNIERIANEGVNFTRTYAPTSMCGPSRASIYTGLYAHQHKAENNNYAFTDSLAKIGQILHDQGYYTGFFGKYGQGFGQPHEFDFFINTTEDDYELTTYNLNGTPTFYYSHNTDVLSNFINGFFDSIQVHNDQPFAIFFFPFGPHPPNTPQNEYLTLYEGMDVNYPIATDQYSSLYPEYYYEATSNWTKDSIKTVEFLIDRFEVLKGIDDVVGELFNYTDSLGITDSTLYLYTSDNGYIAGEHGMRAKVLPIEESIHVPMFVRYKPWFNDSIVMDNDLVELIDIPSTILDLIGVEDTFGFEGHSLRLIAEPDTLRKFARYEFGGDDDPGDTGFDVPDIRGIRSFDHLYTRAECNCYEEEFYDFSSDPFQQTNQILNPEYQELINYFRNVLDSMLIAVDDTFLIDTRDCALIGAYEIEDGIDQDCNGLIDDGIFLKNWYQDLDEDNFGNIDSMIVNLYPVPGYVLDSTDCNDANALINPSQTDYCDGIDNNCDAVFDDIVVTPLVSPSAPVFFCAGGSQTLTATPVIPGFTAHWYLNGISIAGATAFTYNATNSGNYSVKFTAPAGCITTSLPTVITEFVVKKPKVKNSSLSNNLTINNPVKLSVKKVIGQTYQWYYNDVIIWGATSNKFNAGLPGNHKCTVVDLNGCSSTSKNFLVIQTFKEGPEEIPYLHDAEILLFPNPATDNFTLEFTSNSEFFGEGRISIKNMLGAEIFTQNTTVMSGAVYQEVNLNTKIASGIYIVELQIGDQKWKQQLVVQ